MAYDKIVVPNEGEKITLQDGKLYVPDNPIVAFIEGDGTGPDIWAASQPVFDAAVEKAYGGKRKIAWREVLAGQKSHVVVVIAVAKIAQHHRLYRGLDRRLGLFHAARHRPLHHPGSHCRPPRRRHRAR